MNSSAAPFQPAPRPLPPPFVPAAQAQRPVGPIVDQEHSHTQTQPQPQSQAPSRVRTKHAKAHKDTAQQMQQQAFQAQPLAQQLPFHQPFMMAQQSQMAPMMAPLMLPLPLSPQQHLYAQMMQMQQAAFSPPPPVPLFVAPSIMQQQQQQQFGFEAPFAHAPMMQQHGQHSQSQAATAQAAASSSRKGGDARPRRPPQTSRPQSAHAAAAAAAADGSSAPSVSAAAPAAGGPSAQQPQSGRTPPVRHTQHPPLPPPVAEYLAVGYLGSCDASGGLGLGFAPAGRSNARLINALCGRTIFPTAAPEEDAGAATAPFAQEALRRARARASKTAAPRPRERGAPAARACRAPIRLAERHASDSESDTESEPPAHPNGAQHLAAAKAGEEHKEDTLSSASPASLLSEDVAAPVSTFAALQLHVDTRNKLLHMQMAPVRPASAPGSASSSPGLGLGLGLDAPLGIESEGWAAELARLPVSFFSQMDGAEFHAWLVSGTSQRLRAALFLFCTCHYVVILHPSAQLQMQWIQLLRLLQALKSRLLSCFASAAPAGTNASGAASATAADAAALYRALFSSIHLSVPESKALSKCSSPLSLCFTPCVSFVVQRPRLIDALGGGGGGAGAKEAEQQFGDAFAAQLAALCAKFDLVAPALSGQADVSPAASAVLLALKHAAPEKPEKHAHNHGHSQSHGHAQGHGHGHGGHGHGHSHGHGGSGTHPALFEPTHLFSSDEQQRAGDSDDAQRQVAPLMYLHTQRPVIVASFDELFDDAAALGAVSSSSSGAVAALRGALERCTFVARAQVDSLSQALPRDVYERGDRASGAQASPQAQGLFSLPRLLHSMQTVHSWLTQRVSPCASAIDAALLHSLHVDYQYSALRCEKAAAVAKKLYVNAQHQQSQLQQSRSSPTSPPSGSGSAGRPAASGAAGALPPGQFFYSALVHRQRLSTCVRLFHKLAGAGDGEDGPGQTAATAADPSRTAAAPLARALGPAVSRYESLLRRDLERYWLDGHRGCDAVSVLHHACIYSLGHDVPRADGSAPSSYPLAHASQMAHSLRLSCHCGLSLLKLAKEPFEPSEIRAALADRCCTVQAHSIGGLVYPQPTGGLRAPVDGSNGWNVLRYERPYNPTQGLSSLRGFYPNAGRTCFLPRVRFSAGAAVVDTFVGLVYECPLGHRWVCEDEESKAAEAAAGGGAGSAAAAVAAAPASRGFPRGRSDCFIFLPCVICRYLRHLQQKAASDAAAEQRQRRLLKEEKRGRLMLQAQRQQHGSADADALAQHTVPSSTVRSHDRYAQLRRILIVTPPAHVAQFQLDVHVKSTKPMLAAPTAAATTNTAPNASLVSSSGGSSASGSAPSSSVAPSRLLNPSLGAATALDNLTPTGSSEAQHALLPPAAFVAVQLPFVFWRREGSDVHCFTSPEAKHCVLLSHAVSLA